MYTIHAKSGTFVYQRIIIHNLHTYDICYVFFPTEGYGGNLNFEKNEKE